MAAAATLAVSLVARLDRFQTGLKRARGMLRGFARDARRLGRQLGALRGVVLGTLGGGAALAGIGKMTGSLNALIDVSERLGLTATQLIALRDAAQSVGISAQTMDMGLQRAFRRISEAAQGTGEARGVLEELGLDAEALNLQGPVQRLQTLANAMRDVDDEQERLRIGMKLFDSEGADLVRVLEAMEGRGFARLIAANRALGRELTKDQIEALRAVRKAWVEFGDAVSTVAIKVATEFAPIVQRVLEAVNGFLADNRANIDRMIAAAGELGESFLAWAAPLDSADKSLQSMSGTLASLQTAWRAIKAIVMGTIEALQLIGEFLGGVVGMVQALGIQFSSAFRLARMGEFAGALAALDAKIPDPSVFGESLGARMRAIGETFASGFRAPVRDSGGTPAPRGYVIRGEEITILQRIADNTGRPQPAVAQ